MKYILIVRRRKNRFIQNFDDMYNKLNEYFKNTNVILKVFDEKDKYNVIQYSKLFYNSNIVIGMFGAGLTNIIFCKEGTAVINIYAIEKLPYMYLAQATALGLKFYGLYNKPEWDIVNVTTLIQIISLYL